MRAQSGSGAIDTSAGQGSESGGEPGKDCCTLPAKRVEQMEKQDAEPLCKAELTRLTTDWFTK
jgi:hypothetical protein